LLLDGTHLVQDALDAGSRIVSALVTPASLEQADVHALVARLEQQRVEIFAVSAAVMAAASPVRSSSAIVAIGQPRHIPADAPYTSAVPLVVIACDVQDPGNLGAIVRVAEAGGASGMIAAGQSADPFGWKALRGSMGSALRLPMVRHPRIEEAMSQARRHGCRLVATAPRDGTPLFCTDLRGPLALLVGGEGGGLSQALLAAADERVTIPMEPSVESLNTAVAAALMIYEARRQRLGSSRH
jgi:TrmH family RNA methyltransferase